MTTVHRRTLLSAVGAGLTPSVGGCLGPLGGRSTPSFAEQREALADEHDEVVGMGPSSFDPETVTVRKDGSVAWLNDSDYKHTVTAYEDEIPANAEYFASGSFDSEADARGRSFDGLLEPGDTYVHTFEVSGDYPYFCVPHESDGMVGTVVVEE